MQTRKRLLLIALVGVWFGMATQGAAAPRVLHVCEDLCVGAASCGQECWLTQWDFDQDHPSTTCGDEGFDCCGDGTCNSGPEGCGACEEDCGSYSCPDPECNVPGDCDTGETCNSDHECVPISVWTYGPNTPACGGACTSNNQCCGADLCQGSPGLKYCAAPSTTMCSDAPPCYGSFNGQTYTNCTPDCTGMGILNIPKDMYCDPGTNKCMFNQGTTCPQMSGGQNVCI